MGKDSPKVNPNASLGVFTDTLCKQTFVEYLTSSGFFREEEDLDEIIWPITADGITGGSGSFGVLERLTARSGTRRHRSIHSKTREGRPLPGYSNPRIPDFLFFP